MNFRDAGRCILLPLDRAIFTVSYSYRCPHVTMAALSPYVLALWHYFLFFLSVHSFKQDWPNILEVSGLGWPPLSKFKAHACVFPSSRLAARRGNIERRKCWLRGKESVRLITKTGHERQPRKQQKLDGVSSQFSRLRCGPCICNAAGWNQVHIAVLSSCVSPFVRVFFSAL